MSLISNTKNGLLKLKQKKYVTLLLSLFTLFTLFISIYFYSKKIESVITSEGEKQASLSKIDSTIVIATPLSSTGLQLFLSTFQTRAMCKYNNNYYIATSGGLLVFDLEGKLVKHYTNLDGLPSIDLTALVVFRSQLCIGTSDNGLVIFNGKDFIHHKIQKPVIRQISSLLATEERLLVGTFDGGLLAFDGLKFTRQDQEIKPIPQITSLLQNGNRLYIGTYASGLYLWQESRWQQITKQENLPSNRITALSEDKRGVIIATDFGVVLRTDTGEIEKINSIPNIISLAKIGEKLWGGLFTGDVVEIFDKSVSVYPINKASDSINDSDKTKFTNTILWSNGEDQNLFALTNKGILRADINKTRLEFDRFGTNSPLSPLTADHISSMAFDEAGRLWIGYFDQGIDIFDLETMQLITHLQDNTIREINFISLDPLTSKMLVATSTGLAVFDNQLQYKTLDERTGINSNMIAHVLLVPSSNNINNEPQLAIATGRGLTLLQGNIARSPISLPNNYLYTSAFVNNRLFVGSLGGLIEMEGLRVIRSLTINNSKLSHNWINALLAVNGTLYIGTNGGGVDALTPTGELINFSPEIGKFDVNPNAMYADSQYLYVGSLGDGIFLLDLKSKIWRKFSQALPSNNVTAIVSNEKNVYFATSNGLLKIDRKTILGN
ncbi:MAG: hypothetical protein JNM06_12915 [Blastocatellia bacterium]|nr:hypothetical protein [Blastocatellia bacterium]